jgi:hypothetical protein
MKMNIKLWYRYLKGSHNLGDMVLNWRIILKWIFNSSEDVDWIGLAQD